jgi:Domain of Unknown Function (DUF1080)
MTAMQKPTFLLTALTGAALLVPSPTLTAAEPIGYTDTPMLPGTPWHVHDPNRPRPREVKPAETFSHNATAPSDAVVLFDGKDLSQWQSDKGSAAEWKVENGYMEAVKGKGNIRTKQEFEDFQLHIEFATPEKVLSNSQGRGNSGVFLLGAYEMQVLDTYDNLTYPDGQCGAMYGQFPPLVNACKPPGQWQSYDIIFEAPRWDDSGKQIKKACVTVIHNGVVLHHKKEYMGTSGHKEVANYDRTKSSRGPIALQDHGNPMRFRNVWIRKLGEYDKP